MEWIRKNIIQILLILISVSMGWAVLNFRVAAIEKQVAEYPSQDWFELKFEEIDKSIISNHDAIIKHIDNGNVDEH